MRLLIDLVHPAHALFFHHAIAALKREGAEVAIASRDKDVLVPVLDGLGHAHEVLTTARDGVAGLAGELGLRNWRLWRMARAFRPDVMASCGGVSISHVGRLLGIPSLSFYDTEHAALQNQIALPFITEWHVQESWTGPEARGRTFRFAGARHSAYLHPDHFIADRSGRGGSGDATTSSSGWSPGRPITTSAGWG